MYKQDFSLKNLHWFINVLYRGNETTHSKTELIIH